MAKTASSCQIVIVANNNSYFTKTEIKNFNEQELEYLKDVKDFCIKKYGLFLNFSSKNLIMYGNIKFCYEMFIRNILVVHHILLTVQELFKNNYEEFMQLVENHKNFDEEFMHELNNINKINMENCHILFNNVLFINCIYYGIKFCGDFLGINIEEKLSLVKSWSDDYNYYCINFMKLTKLIDEKNNNFNNTLLSEVKILIQKTIQKNE